MQRWLTAEESKGPFPSFWATRFFHSLVKTLGGERQDFDQGPLGHPARKSTSVWTNLPINLHGIRGKGQKPWNSESTDHSDTSELARWAPDLRTMICSSIVAFLGEPPASRSDLGLAPPAP